MIDAQERKFLSGRIQYHLAIGTGPPLSLNLSGVTERLPSISGLFHFRVQNQVGAQGNLQNAGVRR